MRLLTNSECRCYRECPRKHKLRYHLGYRPLATPEPLRFGSLVHYGLEQLWSGHAIDLSTAGTGSDAFELAKAQAMLDGYVTRWGQPENVQAVECEFATTLTNPKTGAASRTYQLGGKLDAIQLPATVEHKTSGSDISPGSDYWRQLHLDQQVSIYFRGAASLGYNVTECLYDVLGKPKLRPYKANKRRKEDETPEEYGQRIREVIAAEPGKYYQRGTVVRLADEAEEAAWDLWQTARLIRESELAQRWPRNPDACFKWGRACEYFDHCTGCASLDDEFLFRKATTPHEELQEVT